MNKIGNKIILGFGVFIIILLVQLVLNQTATEEVSNTGVELSQKIRPAVTLLTNFKTDNKELILLAKNKVIDRKNEVSSNRIKQIIEVDFPYFKYNTLSLKKYLEPQDPRNKIIDTIIVQTSKSIAIINDINSMLVTSKDYDDPIVMQIASNLANNNLADVSFEMNNNISFLLRKYNNELEDNFTELSLKLKKNSRLFLGSSITFILIGLFITYKTTKSIVKPINALMAGSRHIGKGNYDAKIRITGKDELATLGRSFNNMTTSLKASFDNIHNKNKELEQFVYIASHDLQEPLRTLNSFSDLLEEEYKHQLDDTAAAYLMYIKQASHRMSLLVKGLLDFSRIGKDRELSEINCNELLFSLQEDLSVMITKENATIEVGELPTIIGYKTEFRLLFQNLINNAMKFHKADVAPVIKIQAEEDKNFWKFSITDNGIGIPENQKERIFGMFHRLNSQSKFEGTGIGLAHCAKITELHLGTIGVNSKLNEGSTFYITISKKLKDDKIKMHNAD